MDAIFYLPDLDINASECALPQEEAKHVVRVLRMQVGDTLLLTDGAGHFVNCHISAIEGKKCTVVFDKIEQQEALPYTLHLAVAPTKNTNRYEWLLEKATEIGVASIIPLISSHSERKTLKTSRLEKILIAAMKQSQKAYLPKLHEPMTFAELLANPFEGKKYIAHCNQDFSRISVNSDYKKGEEVTILIGPEGDFSPEEIQKAQQLGYKSVHFGNSRLRTETAGIVACSTIYQLNF